MKNASGLVVELGRNDGSSTSAPDEFKFKPNKKFALAAAVLCWAVFGLSPSANAEGGFAVTGINSALPAWSQAAGSDQPYQPPQSADDSTISALTSFAQQIGAEVAKADSAHSAGGKFDDQAYSELRDFAQRIGAGQPTSLKNEPKLAEAQSLFEFLKERGEPSQPAPAAKKGPVAGGKKSSAPVEAHYVGAKVCLTCHASQAAAFDKTLMGRIGKTQKGKFDCENCHGPGSAHAKAGGGRGVGGIISFRPDDQSRTADENNAICLACHERGDRTYWNGSTHETRGLMCTNCHTIMKAVSRKHQLKTAFEPETCFQCHKDRRAQMFRSSHMPLREGKLVCSDCHNPHGSPTEAMLRGDSINDNCYKCHAEKRGPFLFEHAPVRENCDNCHEPHGSVNEFLLRVPRQRLCATCHGFGHGLTSGPLAVQSMGRSCQNCHTKVHGTNDPSGALLHR